MVTIPTTKLTERFEEALVYATRLHATQLRKASGVPYIAHLLSVAALVLEQGGDEDMAIAALLHDAVEDRGGEPTREEIRRRFGERVTAIVDGCTEIYSQPKPPWKERKLHYLEQLRAGSQEALLVSLADKLHNARSLVADGQSQEKDIWKIFNKEETLWFYRELLEIYRKLSPGWMVAELEGIVGKLEKI